MKDIVKFLLSAFIILTIGLSLLTSSCTTLKEVPIQSVEKIIYRDTLIYIKDSIKIDVPYEVIKEVTPEVDTSFLKTSLAESIAYLDTTNKKIVHTLTQKGEITTKIDTVVKFQYIDKIIEKEVPVQVEVIKTKYDTLFWVLAGWAVLCIVFVILKLYFRR